MTNDTMGS